MLSIEGREVRVSHPDKLYFSKQTKLSKLDLVRYYLSIAPGALAGIRDRPLILKRFVKGAEQEAFYQKRAPEERPSWLRTVTLSFPSGRTAEELLSMMQRDSRGSSTWVVSSCTHTQYAQVIWSIRTSCGSISIQVRASTGPTCDASLWK